MAQNDQALMMRLKDNGLEFVIIGGVCVVFHGAPVATFDLDICCPFGDENVKKIEAAVKDLNPTRRLTPLESTRSAFRDLKNLYLDADSGKLDCLSEVKGVGSYDEVRKQSVVAHFAYGEFRFLNLDALISAKNAVGRERDLDAVRRLTAIKEKKNNRNICVSGDS